MTMSGFGRNRDDADRQGGFAEFEQRAQDLAGEASDGARAAAGRARDVARRAAGSARRGADEAGRQAMRAEASIEAMIRDRPLGSLLVAAALGMAVALLIPDSDGR